MSETIRATVCDCRVRSDRAIKFGRYPIRIAASRTRRRVASLIRFASIPPASTRLTVLTLVRVSRAMSDNVGVLSDFLPAVFNGATLSRVMQRILRKRVETANFDG